MAETQKVIIVGDGAIGKTCLLSRLTNDAVDWSKETKYEPTTFNNFKVEWEFGDAGEILELELWDTAGQEAFGQLRTLSYPGTDIYLIGYSTTSEISLANVEHKWLVEIMDKKDVDGEDPWIILVGTKCDIRDGLTVEMAEKTAEKIGASFLIDTSAKTEEGIQELKSLIMSMMWEKKEMDGPRPKWEDRKKHQDGGDFIKEVIKDKEKTTFTQKEEPTLALDADGGLSKPADQSKIKEAEVAQQKIIDATPKREKKKKEEDPAKKAEEPNPTPKTDGRKKKIDTKEQQKVDETGDVGCTCAIA